DNASAGGAGKDGRQGVIAVTYTSTGMSVSGTTDAANGTTVKVAVNSSVQAQSTTVSAGAWTITGVTVPLVNDIITVWLDGVADASESTGITKYSFGNVTGMDLTSSRLAIGSNQNTSLTITNLGQYDFDDDEDVMHTSNSGTLLVQGGTNSYTAEFVYIDTGETLTVSTGESVTSEGIRVLGSLVSSGTATYTVTGTSGNLFYNQGTWIQSTSTFNVTSASGSPTLLTHPTTFHKLTINATATVINAGQAITMSSADASNKLYVQAGVLNDAGNTIVGTANGTLEVASGAALCVSGANGATNATCDSSATPTTASTFPTNYTNGNITLGTTSTIYYNADAAQTISSTPTYGNLYLKPTITSGRTFTAGGALTINGDFTINPTAASALALTVNPAGNITVASGKTTTITRTTSATSTLDLRPVSTDYNLSTGLLNIATGGTLDATSAVSTITLTATSGTLFTNAGTFTQGTSEVLVTGAGSTTLLSAGTTFHKLTINNSGNTVSAGAVITMSNASATNKLYIQSGNLNDGGNTIVGTANGTLVMDSGNTLYIGSSGTASTFPTNYTNGNITLSATSTVVYQSGQNQTVSAVPTYGHLTITPLANTPTMTVGSATTVAGNFLSNTPANLTNTGGITVSGSGTATIYDNDDIVPGVITTNGGAILINADRDASTAGSVNIAGAITSNGGSITIGGGSGTISAGSGFAVGSATQATGVLVNGVTVAAAGGAVVINGQGYNTTTNSNHGVRVTGAAGAITATGNGTINITGNGKGSTNSASNYGLEVDAGGIISTVNGNLTISNSTGGGAGSGTGNYGVYITGTNSTIKTTGSGSLSVTGTGGNGSGSG
ncbi:MAG: hypothetical protein AAB438_01590, partial [Patescibacteria group bacterium]